MLRCGYRGDPADKEWSDVVASGAKIVAAAAVRAAKAVVFRTSVSEDAAQSRAIIVEVRRLRLEQRRVDMA